MAAQIFNICRNRPFVGMSLEINDSITSMNRTRKRIRTRQNSSKYVQHIDLNFKVQLKCSHFLVYEDGITTTTSFLNEHTSRPHPLATYKLPISIFKHGDKALEQYLFHKFHVYREFINTTLVADRLIQHWVKRVEEDDHEHQEENNNHDFNVFQKIYPLEITLEMRIIQRYVEESPIMIMVPTSDSAIESMLRRVENDWDDEGINCVICLEEISSKEEEESEKSVLQMPCLHMFHGECINKWLKTSHYCPTCRFSMPTNN
ncbi:putative zinc finger protein [Cucumis melo var. makuwa]|uniref:RING-type E3 ubiquitin transferase n=2 Tax=Cucumis melo TaxID=3656 RepID=A0A5D3C6D9_CUCMM|nr:putative zinc finger protein [Cucumis melo var. makuwa]